MSTFYQMPDRKDVNRPQLRVVTSYAGHLHLATPLSNEITSAGSSPRTYAFQTSKRASQSRNATPRRFPRSHLPSPSPSDIGSTRSSPRTAFPCPPSPTSSSSGSSTSGKSVRWGGIDEQGHIGPGQYSTRSPKSPSKTVLKCREVKAANMPSLFAENTPIVAASAALDNVLCDLVTYVKEFKCPSELDFSVNTGSALILANVEKNKVFIKQLRKLDGLRTRLAEIPTHGSSQLIDKHKAAGAAIGRALRKMKQDQLELYDAYTKAVDSALDDIAIDLNAYVNNFDCSSEFDFPSNSEDGSAPFQADRNQFRRLEWFREALNKIPSHGNEQLQDKHRAINMGIDRALQRIKERQLRLYKQHAYRPHQI